VDPLLITIKSFGFHVSGIPEDDSGHGGGFVFDCRGLPNPGREEQFRRLTGQDQEIQRYLEKDPKVGIFLDQVYALVLMTAQNYQERGFTRLTVTFGCTGGQHRSVYCAEKMADRLDRAGFSVRLIHIDKPSFT
jgi:RNase adaptor protein for sRNA GlmZ degradation